MVATAIDSNPHSWALWSETKLRSHRALIICSDETCSERVNQHLIRNVPLSMSMDIFRLLSGRISQKRSCAITRRVLHGFLSLLVLTGCDGQADIGARFQSMQRQPGVVLPMFCSLASLLDKASTWRLYEHIISGYKFLMQNDRESDTLCIFGERFSFAKPGT